MAASSIDRIPLLLNLLLVLGISPTWNLAFFVEARMLRKQEIQEQKRNSPTRLSGAVLIRLRDSV